MGAGGGGGVKNFSVGICDGAPLTARSSLEFQAHTGAHKRHIISKIYNNQGKKSK